MHRTWFLLALALGSIEARSNTCTAQPQSSGAHCIQGLGKQYAAAYCSSILSLSTSTIFKTTTLTNTVTVNTTTTTGFSTYTGTPPVTDTISTTTSVNKTRTYTHTKTSVVSTKTSYIDTTTLTVMRLSTVFTCGKQTSTRKDTKSSDPTTKHGPVKSTRASASIIASNSQANTSMTIHHPSLVTSCTAEPTNVSKMKRQSVPMPSVRCLRKFARSHGEAAISSACDCLGLVTPSPVTRTVMTTDPSVTITSTSTLQVEGTTTITPTVTDTKRTTTTASFSTTTRVSQTVIKTMNATSTTTVTSVSQVVTSSPIPSSFNIFFLNTSSQETNPPANFFKAVTAPGGSGIVLAPEASADNFAIDAEGRLVDTTDGNEFITKNTEDLYPFELLKANASAANTPICSACNSTLTCDYPGTSGNTFALCYGYLALGPRNIFSSENPNSNDATACSPIKLLFK